MGIQYILFHVRPLRMANSPAVYPTVAESNECCTMKYRKYFWFAGPMLNTGSGIWADTQTEPAAMTQSAHIMIFMIDTFHREIYGIIIATRQQRIEG